MGCVSQIYLNQFFTKLIEQSNIIPIQDMHGNEFVLLRGGTKFCFQLCVWQWIGMLVNTSAMTWCHIKNLMNYTQLSFPYHYCFREQSGLCFQGVSKTRLQLFSFDLGSWEVWSYLHINKTVDTDVIMLEFVITIIIVISHH